MKMMMIETLGNLHSNGNGEYSWMERKPLRNDEISEKNKKKKLWLWVLFGTNDSFEMMIMMLMRILCSFGEIW